MVINNPTVFKFSIFDFGPLMYGSILVHILAVASKNIYKKIFIKKKIIIIKKKNDRTIHITTLSYLGFMT